MRIVAFFLGAFLVCAVVFENRAYAVLGEPSNEVMQLTNVAFQMGHVDDLENLAANRRDLEVRTSSGMPALMEFYKALSSQFDPEFDVPRYWSPRLRHIERLVEENPNSVTLLLTQAHFYMNWAWNARGNGFANEVPDEAMALFRERNAIAQSILDNNDEISDIDPHWYVLKLALMVDAGQHRSAAFAALIDEGTEKFPYYPGIYFAGARGLGPQWGGSMHLVEEFARIAVERTRDKMGAFLYPLIMWEVSRNFKFEPLLDPVIDWELMAAGMEVVAASYPVPWNFEHFALFSCMGGQFETTANMLDKKTEIYHPKIWEGEMAYRICRSLADRSKQ